MKTFNGKVRSEIRHKEYNLNGEDNLEQLPNEHAVFGIFALVDDEPVNCRCVGGTDSLQKAIRELFENPMMENLKLFMRGPWLKILVYDLLPDPSPELRQAAVNEWLQLYQPGIDDDGEYPGYYNY